MPIAGLPHTHHDHDAHRSGCLDAHRWARLVTLLEPGEEDDDQETIFLRVDRGGRHTVDSLLTRNSELYASPRSMVWLTTTGWT
jgi:hypothetical protein